MLDSSHMGSHALLGGTSTFGRLWSTNRDKQKRLRQDLARTLLEQRRFQHDKRRDESD